MPGGLAEGSLTNTARSAGDHQSGLGVDFDVAPDAVVGASRDDLPVPMTPSIILVDSRATVWHAWLGVLSPELEAEVLAVVRGDFTVLGSVQRMSVAEGAGRPGRGLESVWPWD